MNEAQKVEQSRRDEPAMLPAVDVIESADGIVLRADLPGVPKDRLDVQVETDSLTIEGELSLPLSDDMQATHAEVALPRYRRVFTLSRDLDPAGVKAEFANGVLTLRIPKAAHAQPRKIRIDVA